MALDRARHDFDDGRAASERGDIYAADLSYQKAIDGLGSLFYRAFPEAEAFRSYVGAFSGLNDMRRAFVVQGIYNASLVGSAYGKFILAEQRIEASQQQIGVTPDQAQLWEGWVQEVSVMEARAAVFEYTALPASGRMSSEGAKAMADAWNAYYKAQQYFLGNVAGQYRDVGQYIATSMHFARLARILNRPLDVIALAQEAHAAVPALLAQNPAEGVLAQTWVAQRTLELDNANEQAFHDDIIDHP